MNRSKLADRANRHDRFHQKAKREGFLARAVYKLTEIDEKFDLFDEGDHVLDLGCAPGSWLQYARQRVGETGALVGLDRGPLQKPPPGARIVIGDVMTIEPAVLRGDVPAFDVVLSDMAPDTSGIRSLDQARSEALFERALELALALLAPGGHFVGKLFQGPDFKRLIEVVRSRFDVAKTAKPTSSRQISIEQYVIGKGFKGTGAAAGRAGGTRDGATGAASGRDGSTRDGATRDGGGAASGRDGSARDGAAGAASGRDGSARDGATRDGAPRGRDGSARDGATRDGGGAASGRDGSTRDGATRDGGGAASGRDGSTRDGATRDGATRDGGGAASGRDGSTRDGGGDGGASTRDGSKRDGGRS